MEVVQAHSGGGYTEGVRGTPVEERVERQQNRLGEPVVVPAPERGLDLTAPAARVHAGAHIERPLVVHKADLRALSRQDSLYRFLLNEIVDRCCLGPHGLVEASVQPDALSIDLNRTGRFREAKPRLDGVGLLCMGVRGRERNEKDDQRKGSQQAESWRAVVIEIASQRRASTPSGGES